MLDEENKKKSFDNVYLFVGLHNGTANSFRGTFNVQVVSHSEEYLYHNVEIYTSYDYANMAYKVSIIWEDDLTQKDYKDLGLHSYYSTNFQLFLLKGNTLVFDDGEKEITIFS